MTVKASSSSYCTYIILLSRNESRAHIRLDRFTRYQCWQCKLTVATLIIVHSLFYKGPKIRSQLLLRSIVALLLGKLKTHKPFEHEI